MARLVVVPTPIGNLEDITLRALRVLKECRAIACEDTRRTWTLLSHFSIPRPETMFSYRQGNEDRTGDRIGRLLDAGVDVALCSDGGMPSISDPGYRAVRAAVERGHTIEVLPGPSAVLAALVASGLPSSSFTFKGFPPRRPGVLARFFEDEREQAHTLVVFEAPYRLAKTLAAAAAVLGNRETAVCFELTKKFERVERGGLCDLAAAYAERSFKGEIAVVIAGNNPKFIDDECVMSEQGADGEEP